MKAKPPIGYKAFVTECLKFSDSGGKREAGKYVHKIADPAERCEMFCNLGMFRDAIATADKEKDPDLLHAIRCTPGAAQDKSVIAQIDQLLSQY